MKRIIRIILLVLYLFPDGIQAQLIVWYDPKHCSGEKEYISVTTSMTEMLAGQGAVVTLEYQKTMSNFRQVAQLKRQEYEALSTAYAFYSDTLRTRRFIDKMDNVRSNLRKGLAKVSSNSMARQFFTDPLLSMLKELEDIETVFRQATEASGNDNQMTNGERNRLLFRSEDWLEDLARRGQRAVDIGKMLTLDPEDLERKAGELYRKQP